MTFIQHFTESVHSLCTKLALYKGMIKLQGLHPEVKT